MAEQEYVIQVNKLTKEYQNKRVLGPLDLRIKKGEKLALVGANGSGKTTLCEIIANLRQPTKGKVKYAFSSQKLAQVLSISFQEQIYPSKLIVEDLVNFYHSLYPNTNLSQKELWEKLQIAKLLKQKISKLSGGQKQRLNLYLALFYQPQIFIGDEITTGLDLKAKIEITNFLLDQIQQKQMTLILVTHHWEEIISLGCSRVILLDKGLLIDDTTPQDIQKKYPSLLAYYSAKTSC